ncbi:MAG: serine/threonine protein kinase, partial [Candidatus Melainabacteria bacterium]|nr:serine/threonine protein kinase [Candidatus Melainabacteria bacterium]
MGRLKKQRNLSENPQAEQAGAVDDGAVDDAAVEAPAIAREADATLTIVRVQAGQTPPGQPDYIQEGIIDARYQILSILGKGGMGTVFLAKHLVLNRIRAVKVLHPHLCSDGNAVIRFRNEAAAVSALEHANIITVHDSGTNEAGIPYIAMDFIEGDSLSQLIQDEGALPVSRALPIFRQVAEALSHAHEKGIVHRDLKPSNILLVNSPDRKDFVKVVDFGIAKILPQENVDAQKLTQTGDVFGSPLYMSPEQCMGGKLDERSDIYSLGCLMHEALTGAPPFVGNTAYETFLKHMNEEPPGLKSAVKDRSTRESLEAILFAALAKEPEKRYQSMRRLADHMRLVEEGMHRGILARVKNWWYLKQLKRGPQRRVIPFGRFVAAMTMALYFTVLSVFLIVDLARDEPLDYYQNLLWSNIILKPELKPTSAAMQRKVDRAKQLALAMLNLPGGVAANQDNTLKTANSLKEVGRFNEAAPFYRDLLKAQLKESNSVKKY